MDDQTLEPAVAIEQYKADEEKRRKMAYIGTTAFLSALAGAAAVLAALYFAPQWFVTPKTVFVSPSQSTKTEPLKAPAISSATYVPDKGEDPILKVPATETGPQSQPTANPPTNPLKGPAGISTNLPDGWPGEGPPPGPGLQPGALGTQPVSPPVPEGGTNTTIVEGSFVSGRSAGGDVETESQEVVRALRATGASVKSIPHYSLAGSMTGHQIVATVPSKSLAKAMSGLKSAGVRLADEWKGPLDERRIMVSSMLSSRIEDLKRSEAALKEKYEDDASEVMNIRDEMKSLDQALSMTRGASSAGISIIVVGIGAL